MKKQKLVILPGFSFKNKGWAYECAEKLSDLLEVKVIEWDHWKTGDTALNWIENEIKKINKEMGDKKVNILAKSIGTLIAMLALKPNFSSIDKLILCGIPMNDFNQGDGKNYQVLKTFPKDKLLVIQNENDNHGSYKKVKEFLDSINSEIKIISKPRNDHEYPYWNEFRTFWLK